MFDLRGDRRPGHFGESAIDECGSGNKPPKSDEVKRKIDMGLHKMWRLWANKKEGVTEHDRL